MEISGKNFLEKDVLSFFNLISDCIEKKLFQSKNTINLISPDWDSHNTSKSILCNIDDSRYVCLKRYDDNHHFAKQEVVTSKLKKQIGFPYYNVIKSKDLLLRLKNTQKNPEILNNWEKNLFLAIDFGNYTQSKNLRDLPIDKVENSKSFYNFYGKWAAFNYLFGIQDRNSSNFVYFLDSGIMHSVDNEVGPIDWLGRNVGILDIIYRTRKGFTRYISNSKNSEYKKLLIEGFIDGWNLILKNVNQINVLNENEIKLFQKRLCDNPKQIANIFFDYTGKWNKL